MTCLRTLSEVSREGAMRVRTVVCHEGEDERPATSQRASLAGSKASQLRLRRGNPPGADSKSRRRNPSPQQRQGVRRRELKAQERKLKAVKMAKTASKLSSFETRSAWNRMEITRSTDYIIEFREN